MTAPLDTIDLIDTAGAEGRRMRLQSILERLEALKPTLAERPVPTAKPADSPSAVVQHTSAWAEAVHVGEVRARRKAQGLDVSVRAIAIEVGCSRSHVGECLQIRSSFTDTLLFFVGENGDQDDGRARLARLSFRTLRSLARLPTGLARCREARRLSNQPDQPDQQFDPRKEPDDASVTSAL